MTEFWMANGFYLWMLTTALAIVALAWLAWNTFADQPEAEEAEADQGEADDQKAGLSEVSEALPHMQATLGRSLQFYGLERFADTAGAQAFALAVVNARGDGFVLSSSVRGGLSAKPLSAWGAQVPLTPEEERAIQLALEQRENRT